MNTYETVEGYYGVENATMECIHKKTRLKKQIYLKIKLTFDHVKNNTGERKDEYS